MGFVRKESGSDRKRENGVEREREWEREREREKEKERRRGAANLRVSCMHSDM